MPLPPGLILNPATGELEGVPTVAGTYAIQLKVRDALGSVRELTDEVVINAYTPITWSGDLGPLMATRPATQIDVARAGGLGPFAYAVQSGGMPDGLSLNASTGAITGTPSTPGGYAFTLRVIDSIAQQADYLLAGTVAENLTLGYAGTGKGAVGKPFSETLTVAGGTAPYTYSVATGSLPAGLTFAGGVLSGTPEVTSNASVTLRVTDADGFTADAAVAFDIRNPPRIAAAPTRGMVGKAYSHTVTGSGGFTPYVFSATGLPPGLSISSATGAVSGTPSTPGTYDPTFHLVDDLGILSSATRRIEIAAALALSGNYATEVTRGNPYSFTPSVNGGWAPFAHSVSAGSLPPGLSQDPATGAITGTPTTQGIYSATLRVTDADGSTATMAFNVSVAGDLSITGSAPNYGTTTVAYTGDNLASAGGTAPYSWSVAAGSLPPGLSLNTSSGDISGTPTTPGSYEATVRVTDANLSYAQVQVPIVVAAYPTLAGTLPDAYVGQSYSAAYSAAGGHAPLTYSLAAGTLPAGLSLNASTGAITGTPSATGTSNFTVRATDARGNVADRAGSIAVYTMPALAGNYAGEGEVEVAYSSSAVTASGGKAPLSWSIAGGTLPPGLSLNSGTGVLSGTPTGSGTFNFTVRVTDANGRTASRAQSTSILSAVDLVSGPRTTATRGVAYNSAASASGGKTPYTYSISLGQLPAGLSLNASTGAVTGTPTTTGSQTFTLRVQDALGGVDAFNHHIAVADPVALSGSAPKGTVGVGYSFTPTRTGGWGPFSYSIVSGALPGGLSLNASTGAITGTPNAAGTFNFTMRVVDTVTGGGSTDDHALSIVVAAYPVLSLTIPRGMVGKAYSGSSSTSGGHSPYTYSIVSGALPNGLSISSATGAISGTPTTSGTFSFTVRSRDALGNNADKAGSIAIAAALTINGAFANGERNKSYSSSVSASGGYSPYTFSLAAGTLPTGLSLSGGGTLSGTPSADGTFNFTVRVTDADGSTYDKAMSVVINPPAALSVSADPNPSYGWAVTNAGSPGTATTDSRVSVSGGTAPYTYSWARITAGTAMSVSHSGDYITASLTATLNAYAEETWRCTVNDSGSLTAYVDVRLICEVMDNR